MTNIFEEQYLYGDNSMVDSCITSDDCILTSIGPRGEKGDTGARGPKGEKGDIGETGATGAQGPRGERGEQGPRGDIGPKGDTGAQGLRGPVGPEGPQGPQGIQGPTGATGAQGPQGIQGVRGPKGDIGPGFRLKGEVERQEDIVGEHKEGDCYFITSTKHVVIWTGSEWIDLGNIKGPQGEEGPTGPQGPIGPVGPQGERGPAGAQGIQGPIGPQGPPGQAGAIDAYTKAEANKKFVNAFDQASGLFGDANSLYTQKYVKTYHSTKNITYKGENIANWGTLYFVPENLNAGTGMQFYFALDGPKKNNVFIRAFNKSLPNYYNWRMLINNENLQEELKPLQQQLATLTLKYERLLMTLGLEDEEIPQFGTLEELEHIEKDKLTTLEEFHDEPTTLEEV